MLDQRRGRDYRILNIYLKEVNSVIFRVHVLPRFPPPGIVNYLDSEIASTSTYMLAKINQPNNFDRPRTSRPLQHLPGVTVLSHMLGVEETQSHSKTF